MNKIDRSVLVPTTLMLVVLLTVWLGVAGALVSDAQAAGYLKLISDWQTLIAGIMALGAAYVAVRPVKAQLNELRLQSATQTYELLKKDRLVVDEDFQLSWELRKAALNCTGLLEHMAKYEYEIRDTLSLYVGYCEEYLAEQKQLRTLLDAGSVKRWGTIDIRAARHEMTKSLLALTKATLETKHALHLMNARHSAGSPASPQWIADKKKLRQLTFAAQVQALDKAVINYSNLALDEIARLSALMDRAYKIIIAGQQVSDRSH